MGRQQAPQQVHRPGAAAIGGRSTAHHPLAAQATLAQFHFFYMKPEALIVLFIFSIFLSFFKKLTTDTRRLDVDLKIFPFSRRRA